MILAFSVLFLRHNLSEEFLNLYSAEIKGCFSHIDEELNGQENQHIAHSV